MAWRKWKWIGAGVVMFIAGGTALATLFYPYLAVYSAPRKVARPSQDVEAAQAREAFWTAFQSQRHEALPEVTESLTAAYLKNPGDPKIALLVAHAHFWKAAERTRNTGGGARITDELVLANFYFREAYKLQPDDHRIGGWLASTELALASIHNDEQSRRRGYFMLRQSARDAPEFNHFTLGYVLSRLPAGDPRLQDAVESMWSALDACLDRKMDRRDPDVSPMGSTVAPEGPKRVCFNGLYTPHNVEGFFLAFGDLLVKTGDPALARTIYGKAKVAPNFEAWPFKATLEERVQSADERSARFAAGGPAGPEMIGTSAHACAVCHAL